MIRWIVAVCAAALLWLGCSRKAPAPAVAKVAPPQYAIRTSVVAETNVVIGGANTVKTKWAIQVAQFHDHQIEELGLKSLFDAPIETNELTRTQLAGHALTALAGAETNVALTVRPGAHVGVCSSVTFSNMVDKFMRSTGVDLLTAPVATALGTNQAQVTVQDSLTVVIPPNPGGVLRTTNIAVGQILDFRVLGTKGESIAVQLASTFQQFKGYSPSGSGSTNVNLDLAVLAKSAELGPGEALLLGSGIDRSIQQVVERVPYLSDLPLFGRLFEKRHVQTNYLRQVVMIRPVGSIAQEGDGSLTER